MKRIRASGLTVLIVEQNVQQVLKVVDRAYLLEAGSIRASGTSEEMLSTDTIKQAYLGGLEHDPEKWLPVFRRNHAQIGGAAMQAFLDIFDIYLLEAVINGILLGRRAGVAGARAQPDLRRHRRHLDLLRPNWS